MRLGDHCYYYASTFGAPIVTHAAHYDRDLGDGTSRLWVRLGDGSETPLEGPQCSPDAPIAGCWSIVPDASGS